MPAAALGNGQSNVSCTDGTKGSSCGTCKWHWDAPSTQVSEECSTNVFINGFGAVRKNDKMAAHPDGDPCTSSPINHQPGLSSYSANVFVNGLNVGRVGDKYNSDGHFSHIISSGSHNVFIGSGYIYYTTENNEQVTTQTGDALAKE